MVLTESGLNYLWGKILNKIGESTADLNKNIFTDEYKQKLDSINIGEISSELSSLASRITSLESQDIIVKTTYYEFPNIGKNNCFYVDTANGKLYIWDELKCSYTQIKSGAETFDIINGGNANG